MKYILTLFILNFAITISLFAQMKQDSLVVLTNITHAYPNWSPDGTKIAFQSNMLDDNFEIYVINSDGTGLSRLTNNNRQDETPIWTQDSSQIIFGSIPPGGRHEIYIMNADGSNERNITNTPDIREDHPKLSPNGSRIIFNSDRDSDPNRPVDDYNYEIYEMNLDGTGLQRLTDHYEWDTYPEISPDGSRIVWRRIIREEGRRNSEVFIANRDGSNPINLTNYSGFDGYPTWSPDGTKILFVSTRNGPGESPRPGIFVMNPDGTDISQITYPDEEEADVRPWWSPDGKKIVFNRLRRGTSKFLIAHVSETDEPVFLNPITDGELVSDDGSSRGVAWADYDQNGYPDLIVANTMNALNFVYKNNGDRSFSQITEDLISISGKWSEGITWVDVDNDSDLDLFVANQWDGPNQLFLNHGDDGFQESANSGDLTNLPSNSPGSCWADYDLDGDMDVYVITRDGEDDSLFKNNGEGSFERVITGNISSNGGDGRSCAWGDVDGDRFPELYVGNFIVRGGEDLSKARNFFYKNNGDGTFTEITEGSHVTDLHVTYGVSLVDYDYDEDLDLFVTNIASSDTNILYENDGNGNFSKPDLKISEEQNRPSKGHTWGDFNNDGYLDLFIANGTMNIEPEKVRNMLFLGNDQGDFDEITDWPVVNKEGTSAGTAWADYDRDGDLDLFVGNWSHNNEDNEFYRNDITESKNRNWIGLHLRGTQSNTFGIGAKVRIQVVISGEPRVQTRWLWPNTGYGSQNEPFIHFGLGDADRIELVEITWPSGIENSFTDLKVNQYFEISEEENITPKHY